MAWLCADKQPTDKLPGHSGRSRASLHEALEETVSQRIHSGDWAAQSGPFYRAHEKQTKSLCICDVLNWQMNYYDDTSVVLDT